MEAVLPRRRGSSRAPFIIVTVLALIATLAFAQLSLRARAADPLISQGKTTTEGRPSSGTVRPPRSRTVLSPGQAVQSLAFRVPDAADSRPTVAATGTSAPPQLTPTQRKILVALCRPYKGGEFAAPATNGQIAAEVFLSVDAVKAHLRALFQAFGVDHLPQNQKRAALAILQATLQAKAEGH